MALALAVGILLPGSNANLVSGFIQLSAKRQSTATPSLLFSTTKGNEEVDSSDHVAQQADAVSNSLTSSQKQSLKSNTNKKRFNRESLSKLGVSALLAYNFVSNVSGAIAISCAWFTFSTGVSSVSYCVGKIYGEFFRQPWQHILILIPLTLYALWCHLKYNSNNENILCLWAKSRTTIKMTKYNFQLHAIPRPESLP